MIKPLDWKEADADGEPCEQAVAFGFQFQVGLSGYDADQNECWHMNIQHKNGYEHDAIFSGEFNAKLECQRLADIIRTLCAGAYNEGFGEGAKDGATEQYWQDKAAQEGHIL
jgi:hypothetical protein